MSIDQLSEIKKKVDTISQHLTTETQGKDLSKEKFDTINTEL
jgi:hypothetical protein